MYSAKNALYETPLHFLCASGEHNASNSDIVESEKTLPATAAWLIHRSCPANLSNLKGNAAVIVFVLLVCEIISLGMIMFHRLFGAK